MKLAAASAASSSTRSAARAYPTGGSDTKPCGAVFVDVLDGDARRAKRVDEAEVGLYRMSSEAVITVVGNPSSDGARSGATRQSRSFEQVIAKMAAR